ncbi:MAG: peptidyl-prolyl cis-trans isomerase [Bdellovibrionales bacterium]
MKKLSILQAHVLGFFLFSYLGIGCTRSSEELPQKPLVVVNEKKLTSEEFGRRVVSRIKEYDALYAKQKESLDRVKEEIVSEFIAASLTEAWAIKNGITIDESALQAEINRVRSSYPDDISFRNAFSQEGMTFERWKEGLKQNLYERLVFEKLSKSVAGPTDQEVQEYYSSHKSDFEKPARIRLRQVVLEKEDDARRVMARIRQGGGLEKMAREFSIAPESKEGGDTGWVEKGVLGVFDDAFKMNVGARSDIIKSAYGYHIFEALGKKPATQLSLAGARPTIIKNLRLQKEREMFEKWLGEQTKSAKVLKDDALIRSVNVHTEGQK